MQRFVSRRRLLGIASGLPIGILVPGVAAAEAGRGAVPSTSAVSSRLPILIDVPAGVAVSAKSTSTSPGDHVAVFNLAADGGANNAGLNVVSANTAFSAAEVSGHETGHGTLKVSHVNPGPDPASDANAAAISVDLRAGTAGGTAAQGIFLKSTTGGTSGKIINYVDPTGATLFALLPDGSLLLRPLAAAPAGTGAGLKLCNVGGTLGVVGRTGTFVPISESPDRRFAATARDGSPLSDKSKLVSRYAEEISTAPRVAGG